MKANGNELTRWCAAFAFIALGIYVLVDVVASFARWNGDWLELGFLVLMGTALVMVPLMLGYCVFRRRYYELFSVLAMLGAFVDFFLLSILSGDLGWRDYLFRQFDSASSLSLLALALSLVFLFGPFFAAVWFYRFCIRLIGRRFPEAKRRTWPSSTTDTTAQR